MSDKELEQLAIQTGGGGTVLIADTSSHSQGCKLISVNQDCVFAVLEDIDGKNMMISQGIGANTCTAGSVIRAIGGKRIKTIQLVSGSIWCIT